jgi:1-deoxy-D-xylulose-5-phosphate reductoisomerase
MSEDLKTRVVILGSTGSIGKQALDVIRARPDRFTCVGLVAGSNGDLLARQAAEFGVTSSGVGSEAALELASSPEAEVVLNAVVGAAGLRASVAALSAGRILALANKESLVAGGEVCLAAADAGEGRIVPVDSEHAALAQCLEGRPRDSIARLIITASGGPFRERADLAGVTPDEALAHPTWSMGPKITIDSATLMNKGLEVIEAHHLFGASFDDIDVLVHPQSVVHAAVELRDGSYLMQAAPTDMRLPVSAALSYPERPGPALERLDLAKVGALEFEEVDRDRFRAFDLALKAGRTGGTCPAVLNAANEVAVAAFLRGRIGFLDIPRLVEMVLGDHVRRNANDLEVVLEVDAWARARAGELVDEIMNEGRRPEGNGS